MPKTSLLKRSLGVQIFILIFCITLTVVILGAGFTLYSGNKSMLDRMRTNSHTIYELLRLSIEKPMLVGSDTATSEEFAYLSEKFPNTAISIASHLGTITYSTNTVEIRQPIEQLFSQEVSQIYRQALQGEATPGKRITLDGRNKFLNIVPFKNEVSCYHCHGASQPILGAMAVIQDVDEEVVAFNQSSWFNAAISILGGLLLAFAIYLFVKSRVIKRLQSLNATSEEIISGNFNAVFSVTGADELGRLTARLSQMLDDLKLLGVSESIVKSMSIPNIMCDEKGNVIFVNQYLLDLLGHSKSPQQAVGLEHKKFLGLPPDSNSAISTILKGNTSKESLEISLTNYSGNQLQIQFDAIPVLSLDGKLIGAFSTITDLTAIRAHTQTMAKQNATIQVAMHEAGILSSELASATHSLATQIEQTHNQAQTQQEITSKTALAISEMNHVMENIAQNASEAAINAGGTQKSALQGVEQTTVMSESMQTIVTATNSLKSHMQELDAKTGNIENILQTIQDIADQTNLLALNAAIEAARAGDAGRGFAVVADEVRKLAEKTMRATQEVDAAITDIKQSTTANIQAVDATTQTVTNEASRITETTQALHTILSLAEAVADQIKAIATAAEEQSVSSAAISESTNMISALSKETTTASITAAEAVKALASISDNLNKVIASMNLQEKN